MVMNYIGAGASAIDSIKGLFAGSTANNAAKLQLNHQMELQRQQQEYNTYAYKHRYQWEKEDKMAAGLNQLYGLTQPTAPTSGIGTASMPDAVGEQTAKRQMVMQGIQLGQSGSAIEMDNKVKEQEIKNKKIEAVGTLWDAINKKLEAIYRKKELNYQDKRNVAELNKMKAETQQSLTGAIKNNAEAGSASALTKKIMAETSGIKSTNEKLKRLAEFYKNNPELAGMIIGAQETGGGDVSRGIGAMLGGGVTGLGGKNRKSFMIKDMRAVGKVIKENGRNYYSGRLR